MDEQFVHEDQMRNARTQGVGSMVSEQNRQNALELMRKMHKIDTQNAATKAKIDANLKKALECVDNVRDFVNDSNHVLGNPTTKHGEYAEQVDINFHNADQIMHNRRADATKDGVGRTAPEDYRVNGVAVQSKYINGTNNSLSHVLEHLEKYKDINFGQDGSYYVIPKDQYEQIKKVLSGDTDGLSAKSIRAIKEKIREIEEQTGRSFFDVVRSGNVDYAAVQRGKIMETLDKKSDQLNQTADNQKQRADERSDKKREQGKNVLIENSVFECEKGIEAPSYMVENYICVIRGSAMVGFDDETDKGTVSNCTFVRMNKCIENIGTVQNCIFEKCSEAIIECGFLITENRFAECKNAIVKLCSRATLSNCQFIDCAGKDLVTSRWNSQVTIQDCEFSNISLSPVNSVEEIEQIGELCLKNYIRELIPGKFSTLDTKGVLIEIEGVDKKFANSNRPSKIERCIFNGVHICSEGGFACNMGKWKACKADRNLTKDQMNFLISVYTANYDKFNYPRVIVSDCTFKNCASVHQEIINTEPYDSVFGSRHNYTAISVRNNYGLDNIGDPTSYVKSSDVKLKEIDANGNKIGSSLSVN